MITLSIGHISVRMQQTPKEKRNIAQSEARDKTAKVIAGILPMGSAAYELITTIVVPLHEKKKREFINDLASRLKRLEEEGKIDFDQLGESEEFNTIITKAILLAQQNHQKEKLEAVRNVVTRSALDLPQLVNNYDETEYFLNLIEEINPIQIYLLKFFHNPESKSIKSEKKIPGNPTLITRQIISYLFPELYKKIGIVSQYWRDLQRSGLLIGDDITIGRHTKHKIQKLTTDLGDRFLEMIETT